MQASRRSVSVRAAVSQSWFPGNKEAVAPHLANIDLAGKFNR